MLLLSQITINHQSIIRAAGSKSVLICANLWSIKTAADITRCRVFTLCKTTRRNASPPWIKIQIHKTNGGGGFDNPPPFPSTCNHLFSVVFLIWSFSR